MARYDYRCPACGTSFEVEHPMSEHPEVRCPACGEVAAQVFGASSIVFKGSGFYNTDQRGSKGSTPATSATSSSPKATEPSTASTPSSDASSTPASTSTAD